MPAPLHLLVATRTAEAARRLHAAVRALPHPITLHGPVDSVDAGLRYMATMDAPPDLLVADLRLGDGFSPEFFERDDLELTVYGPKHVLYLVADEDEATPLRRHSLPYHVGLPDAAALADYFEARADGFGVSLSLWTESHAKSLPALLRELNGEPGPVFRTAVTLDNDGFRDPETGRARRFPMPIDWVGLFYVDAAGRTHSAAFSGNDNPIAESIDELEATLNPLIWCCISDTVIVNALAVELEMSLEGSRLRISRPRPCPVDPRVGPGRLGTVRAWLARRDRRMEEY